EGVVQPCVDHPESTRAVPLLAQEHACQEDAGVRHQDPPGLDQHLDVYAPQRAHERLAVLPRRGRLRTIAIGNPETAATVEPADVVADGGKVEDEGLHLSRRYG